MGEFSDTRGNPELSGPSAAVAQERTRIAAELHDGVLQALYVAGMSLQLAEELAGDPDELRAGVNEAIVRIDAAITELRDLISGLEGRRPPPAG